MSKAPQPDTTAAVAPVPAAKATPAKNPLGNDQPGEDTKESEKTTITTAYLEKLVDGLKAGTLVKIGSRKEDDGVTCMSLRSSNFNDKHAAILAQAMAFYVASLKYLDLSDVELTPDGYRALRVGIQLSSIEHLAMRHNNIVDAEARLLLLDEANKQFTFRDNPLKTLDLRYNKISDAAALEIVAALNSKHSLQHLNLSENLLTSKSHKAFAAAVKNMGRPMEVQTQTGPEPDRSCRESCKKCVIC